MGKKDLVARSKDYKKKKINTYAGKGIIKRLVFATKNFLIYKPLFLFI